MDAKEPNMKHVRYIHNKAQIWQHSFKNDEINSFYSPDFREIRRLMSHLRYIVLMSPFHLCESFWKIS